MTPIDTAALRADAEAMRLAGGLRLDLTTATVRALCDGYDEAARLRVAVEYEKGGWDYYDAEVMLNAALTAERDAARQALVALVADLRALCDPDLANDDTADLVNDVRAVIDRHAPATPTTEEDR